MEDIAVRFATPEDARRRHPSTTRASRPGRHPGDGPAQRRRAAAVDGGARLAPPVIVAEQAGSVIGWASLNPFNPRRPTITWPTSPSTWSAAGAARA